MAWAGLRPPSTVTVSTGVSARTSSTCWGMSVGSSLLRRAPGVRGDRPGVGDRALRRRRSRSARQRQVAGRRPAARGVTGRAELMDAVPPAGSAARSAATRLVRRRRGRARDRRGARVPRRGEGARRAHPRAARGDRVAPVGDRRGARPRADAGLRARGAIAGQATAVVAAAYDRGLLLLSCGLYGNVIRLLPRLRSPTTTSSGAWRSWRRRLTCSQAEPSSNTVLQRLPTPPDVRLAGLRKRYGEVAAVDGVDLDIAQPASSSRSRALGLGEDDDAAGDRGLRAAGRGHGRARRASTSRASRRSSETSTPSSRTTRSSRT